MILCQKTLSDSRAAAMSSRNSCDAYCRASGFRCTADTMNARSDSTAGPAYIRYRTSFSARGPTMDTSFRTSALAY